MRVVIVNDASLARGGATALALLEAELLRARGIEVVFAAGDDGGNPMFERIGARAIGLGEKRLLDAGKISAMRGLYNRRTLEALGPAFAELNGRDTVFHVHGWSQILSPSLFKALAPYRSRTVITAHDYFLACPNGAYANFRTGRPCPLTPLSAACLTTACDKRSYAHKLWRAARQEVQRRALPANSDFPLVLMIHEAMREPLVRGGVPAERLQPVPNPVTAWSATRIAAEDNRPFLFVGRMMNEKGPDLAARAARRAGAAMIFVGDGPMLDRLRAEYPEFSYPGRLPPAEVARHAAQARALVMPSRYPEPYGLVAVEALWSGLPALLARDALLAPEIVARGAGLAFDPRDEAEFAAALRTAGDEAQARAMSQNAFSATRDLGLSPAAWADRLLATFEGVLASSAAAGQPRSRFATADRTPAPSVAGERAREPYTASNSRLSST